ncbi:hypothetical protein D051_0736 [Vibrio parahaemolyticus VPCR-2010]|uniref:hypothetical protein n=1 Tax=Vibrio parahaemolyticus TaxID=670 RepID=UPI00038E5EFA|nr:hypothetical protein D051_0736 [Vibrio parahaemolyticus VPCR-2010]
MITFLGAVTTACSADNAQLLMETFYKQGIANGKIIASCIKMKADAFASAFSFIKIFQL